MQDDTNTAPASSAGNEAQNTPDNQGYLSEHQQGAKPGEGAPASPPDANSGQESSTAAPGEKKSEAPESPLDVVKTAMKAHSDEGSPSSKEQQDQKKSESEQAAADADKKAAEGEPADKDKKDEQLPFHNHPRFKEIVSENQQLKERVAEFEEGEIGTNAKRYHDINDFLVGNNLTGDDFANALQIAALMKNNPEKALQAIHPYYNALLQTNGHVLPEDIQRKLDDGVIDEETARAMSVDRARNRMLQGRLQREQQMTRQQREEQRERQEREGYQQELGKIRDAVADWEKQWSESDPDYSKVMPLVRRAIVEATTAKPPRTPEEAVKLANETRDQVKEELRGLVGDRQPMRTVHQEGVNAGSQPTKKPENGLDVVKQAVAGSGG